MAVTGAARARRCALVFGLGGWLAVGAAVAQTPSVPAPGSAAAQTPAQPVPPATAPPAAAAPSAATAEPVIVVPPEIAEAISKVAAQLGEIERAIERGKDRDDELVRLRAQIDDAVSEADRAAGQLSPRRQPIKDQIDKLGPLPAKDQPAEAPGVAQERARLGAQLGEIEAQIKRTELAHVRARQSVGRIQEHRHGIFTRDLVRRTTSPLDPRTWSAVGRDWPTAQQDMMAIGGVWWGRLSAHWEAAVAVVLVAMAAWLLLARIFRRLLMRWTRLNTAADPTGLQQTSVAAMHVLARSLPGITAGCVLVGGGLAFDLFGPVTARIAEGLLGAFVAYILISGLASALLEPRLSRWRMVDLDDRSARRMAVLIKGVAAVYMLDLVGQDLIRIFQVTLPISIVATLATSLAWAALLIAIVSTRLQSGRGVTAEPVPLYKPYWLKLPLLVLALVVIASSLLGYVALGRFLSGHLLLTATGVTLLYLLHIAIGAFVDRVGGPETALGQLVTGKLGFAAERLPQVRAAIAVSLNVALAAVGVPLLMMAWGFSPLDISRTLRAAVFGFEIGHFRVSIARILLAIGLFLAVVFATRLFQRWMHAKVFPTAKFDAGVSNSIDTGVGYAGFAIATVAAVSYAGFDISNLAIVAGALSVGIGFGLQSIVNNFVSGLILLVERPIKVGDWIVVKDRGEGVVRSISVRSTEIETFDRSSLIVPNSELVSSAVVNWTHRNSVGRLKIKIGVSYESDPAKVAKILLEIGEAHARVLSHPKPQAVFEEFGANSMDFSLRVFLADVYDVLQVQTDLRIAIIERFRREGIEIPNPSYDVRLRQWPDASKGQGRDTAALVSELEAANQGSPVMKVVKSG